MNSYESIDTVQATEIRSNLKADCSQCFGLCCTALNLIASNDFAINKPAGTPCPNLQSDFRCGIHRTLREDGFKGCTVFDCLGAGQMVAQTTFGGKSWREQPEHADVMFNVFPVMHQLFEMIAFVSEALSLPLDSTLRKKLTSQLDMLLKFTKQEAESLLNLDLTAIRFPINDLLVESSHQVRDQFTSVAKKRKPIRLLDHRGADWMGKRLDGADLKGITLRGAYLIAASFKHADLKSVDFIGADLRDADFSGADLSTSLFLTQMQVNSAKGDTHTKLPPHLSVPTHWLF